MAKRPTTRVATKNTETEGAPVADSELLPIAQAAAALCLDKKATDPVILHVEKLTSYTDFFVVASAPSERQVAAVASHVEEQLKKAGFRTLGVEGKSTGNWVLLDYGDFVIHVFLDDARSYYDIEGFWSDAPRIAVDEKFGLEILANIEAQQEKLSA